MSEARAESRGGSFNTFLLVPILLFFGLADRRRAAKPEPDVEFRHRQRRDRRRPADTVDLCADGDRARRPGDGRSVDRAADRLHQRHADPAHAAGNHRLADRRLRLCARRRRRLSDSSSGSSSSSCACSRSSSRSAAFWLCRGSISSSCRGPAAPRRNGCRPGGPARRSFPRCSSSSRWRRLGWLHLLRPPPSSAISRLMGSDERAAYTSGVRISVVRLGAHVVAACSPASPRSPSPR